MGTLWLETIFVSDVGDTELFTIFTNLNVFTGDRDGWFFSSWNSLQCSSCALGNAIVDLQPVIEIFKRAMLTKTFYKKTFTWIIQLIDGWLTCWRSFRLGWFPGFVREPELLGLLDERRRTRRERRMQWRISFLIFWYSFWMLTKWYRETIWW